MSDYKKLLVWQKAHALALHAHRVAMGIRAARYSSLRSQIIRAAMSIPTNIVEGRRQGSDPEFARFLRYSLNSAFELEYHLTLARDIGVIPEDEALSLLDELVLVRRLLHGLLNKITGKKRPAKPDESTGVNNPDQTRRAVKAPSDQLPKPTAPRVSTPEQNGRA